MAAPAAIHGWSIVDYRTSSWTAVYTAVTGTTGK